MTESKRLPVSMAVITIAAVVIALAGMKQMSGILAPTLLALFMVILFRPLAVALKRREWPKAVTMIITLVLVYDVLIGMGLTVYLSITQFAATLIDNPDKFNDLIASGTQLLAQLGIQSPDISSVTSLVSPSRIASVATSFQVAMSFLRNAANSACVLPTGDMACLLSRSLICRP